MYGRCMAGGLSPAYFFINILTYRMVIHELPAHIPSPLGSTASGDKPTPYTLFISAVTSPFLFQATFCSVFRRTFVYSAQQIPLLLPLHLEGYCTYFSSVLIYNNIRSSSLSACQQARTTIFQGMCENL